MNENVVDEHKLFVPDNPNFLIAMSLLMALLAGMGIDLYTPSMPAIAQYFQCNSSLVKLTLAAYLLGYGIGQPFFGTLSDCYGRRKLLLVSYFLFFITSLGCALSWNIYLLLFMRLWQGIALAGSGAISKSLMTDCFSESRLLKVSIYIAISWAIGPIIAPAIGGYLQSYLGWKSIFYFFASIGFIFLMLIIFKLPETNMNLFKLNLSDILGRYKIILSNKIFIGSLLCMSIVYSLICVFNALAPFLLQVKLHYSAIAYGHTALVMGFGYFLGSISCRYFIAKYAVNNILRNAIVWMLVMSIAAFVLAYFFPLHDWAILSPIFLILYATGLIFPICMGKCMNLFRHMAGSANAVMGCLFVVMTAIITAMASLLKTPTQMPIALSYVSLTIICWLIYRSMLQTD